MGDKLAAIARLIASAIAIIALVAGVPALLIAIVGNPLPSHVPTIDEIRDLLTQSGQGFNQVLASTLAIMLWVVWAQLMIALVFEIVAAVRRVETSRVPVLPGIQTLAAKLVAGLTLTATLTAGPLAGLAGAAVHLDNAVPAPSPATLVIEIDSAVAEARGEPPDQSVDAPTTSLIVGGETDLWKLAETIYGDGTEWRTIAADNSAAVDAHGHRIDDTTTSVPAGTRLMLSQDADQEAAAAFGTIEVEVEPGDSLWTITADELRTELGREPTNSEITERWTTVVSTNSATLRSGDPDLIHPGEVISVPTTNPASGDTTPPAATEEPSQIDASDALEVDPAAMQAALDALPAAELHVWTPEQDQDQAGSGQDPVDVWTLEDETSAAIEDPVEDSTAASDRGAVEVGAVDRPPAGQFLGDVAADGAAPPGLSFEAPNTTSTGPNETESVDEAGDATSDGASDAAPVIPVPVVGAPAERPVVVPGGALLQPDQVEAVNPDDLTTPDSQAATAKVRWQVLLAGSLILAGGIWALLRQRRKRILARRPTAMVPTEDPEDIGDLEQASATTMATKTGQRSAALMRLSRGLLPVVPPDAPAVLGAIVDDTDIHLLWDGPAPTPLRAQEIIDVAEERWTIKIDDVDSLEPAGTVALPGLLTLGRSGADRDVVLNLEGVDRLDMGGRHDDVHGYALRCAIELALNPLSEFSKVYCIGFGDQIASLPKVTTVDDGEAVINEISNHAAAVAGVLGDASIIDARADQSQDGLDPVVVIDLTEDVSATRDELVAAASRSDGGVMLITWGDTDAEWGISIDDTQLRVGGIFNTTLEALPLDDDLVDLVVKIVDDDAQTYEASDELIEGTITPRIEAAAAAAVDDTSEEITSLRMHDDTIAPAPLALEAGVVVRVLGPVVAQGTYLTGKSLELVALMLANGGRITNGGIAQAMYPADNDPSSAIRKLLERARQALGTTEDDTLRLSYANESKEYVLHDVTSDLTEVMAVIDQIRDDPDMATGEMAELIDSAIQLVEGEPYSGYGIGFEWAMGEHSVAVRGVDDLCRELASIYNLLKNYPRAKWAIRKGLLACVQCEALYHALLDVVIVSGDQAELRQVWAEIETAFDDEVPEGLVIKYTQHVRRTA